jgi:hypothetical protein
MALLAVVFVITPWTVRNYRVLHVLCPVRDNYWHEFYAANYGDSFDLMPPEKHPADNPVEMQKFLAMGETAYIADAHKLAIDYVSQHPAFFVRLTFRRIIYYWTGFWSFSPAFIQEEPTELPLMFYDICVTLLMLRGVRRLWVSDRNALLPYLMMIIIFPLSYYITHPLMDFRQPIEPAIVVLAIAGAVPFRRTPVLQLVEAEPARAAA